MLVDNVMRVPTTLSIEFFKLWLEFLRPYHDLSNKEMDLLACLLKTRHELSKVIFDEFHLDKAIFTEETKAKMSAELGISIDNFFVLLSRIKKKKMIVDGKINKRFIPSLKDNAKEFKMLIYFELNND